MKKLCTLFLTLFVASSVWAESKLIGEIYYDLNNDTRTASVGLLKDEKISSISIPSTVYYSYGQTTYDVVSIGERAFKNCSNLTSVKIPNSVTSIGNSAFYGCSNLTSVTIPNSVISIGESAFYGCSSLPSVTIPNSVTLIGKSAFYGCSNLTSVTIPNSVTSIGASAFSGCSNLTSVTIPNSVTSIGANAFYRCSSLTSVTIPNSVISIGMYAFYGCSNLTSVTIPNSVTSIGEYAFYECSNLTSVTIPNSVTSIGEYAFQKCSLKSITIPSSVTNIGRQAFDGNHSMTSVIIEGDIDVSEGSLDVLKDSLYFHVLNKETVEVGRDGANCYYDYDNSKYVVINSSKDIVIPESITVGENAFKVIGIAGPFLGITSVTIPSSVTYIGKWAFQNSLENITCYAVNPPSLYYENVYGERYTSFFSIGYGWSSMDPDASGWDNRHFFVNCKVTVPCESYDSYKYTYYWNKFDVECIGSEMVELQENKVEVVPEKKEALFKMPTYDLADSYTLTIQNNGVTFCTLTFNAQGQLVNIDFSTTKSYRLKSDVSAYQFTVTGLSAATKYGYSFKALNANKAVLKEYAGSFTTKNEDGTGGSVQGGGEGTLAVEAVSNSTAVTIVNGQILVNGEAPAFVVTVSGKKIENANLKAGVYFVNVEGETVGVSVR